MTQKHPGGLSATERGLELAGLGAGARILDVGCGRGETVNYLVNRRGMKAEGIDINLSAIAEAKERFPGIDVKFGDGEFLDDYMSFTFDGIFMEHTLGRINMPDEALHEACCVMKKGGKLIVADLYEKDPDPALMRAVRIEADRLSRIPHQEGDCENRRMKFVDFRFAGAFYREPLLRQLKETGFHIIAFEDRTEDLEEYLTDAAGGEEAALKELNPDLDLQAGGKKRIISSFLLVAAKPL